MTLDQFLTDLKTHREKVSIAKEALEAADLSLQDWLKESIGVNEKEPISIESMVTLFVKAKNLV